VRRALPPSPPVRREHSSTRLLTVAQAAERLNVSERNIRHQIFQRKIGIVKIGRLVRIDEGQIEELIDAGRVPRIDCDAR
jgi:excisionase family DNA binding protein